MRSGKARSCFFFKAIDYAVHIPKPAFRAGPFFIYNSRLMKLLSGRTRPLRRALRESVSARAFEPRLAILSAICGVAMTAILAILAARAALRLDFSWDAFMYHIPFA